MLRFVSVCLVLVVLASCTSGPVGEPASSPVVADQEVTPDTGDRTFVNGQRIGLITEGMTAEDIRDIYGKGQLVAATLHGPEGITYPGFHLFPGTDDELSLTVDSLGITGETYNPGGHWTEGNHGVRVGTSLAELNRLNGGPFVFSGFDWDYGGYVNDWKGGELEGLTVRLTYGMEVMYDEDESYIKVAVGDQPVRSDAEELQGKGIRVGQLLMHTARKE